MRRLWQLSSSSSLARRQPGLPTPPRILIDRNASGWPPPLGVGGGWSSGCGRLMASGSVLAAAAKDLASYTSSSSSDQQPAGRSRDFSKLHGPPWKPRFGALSAPFRRPFGDFLTSVADTAMERVLGLPLSTRTPLVTTTVRVKQFRLRHGSLVPSRSQNVIIGC
ncbi:hypothetical protein QR680_006075 [Steinernema hermaphroditum]|uniref:Uncharacterized protein n=1 Tax=Steinernema hermaphroditum TaxID=289476 RepID=A0AA39HU73_9BILA|nr:hypothetical protein QR680_006075 [Steinernema hermaphroditum]